jgi:hypothetical protein
MDQGQEQEGTCYAMKAKTHELASERSDPERRAEVEPFQHPQFSAPNSLFASHGKRLLKDRAASHMAGGVGWRVPRVSARN